MKVLWAFLFSASFLFLLKAGTPLAAEPAGELTIRNTALQKMLMDELFIDKGRYPPGGRIRWQVKTPEPLVGGVLATAGDLLFMGEGDGRFNAYDSASGELLWQTSCGAGVNAPPVTYAIGGRQYVAVAAGGNAVFGFKQGDTIHVYALPE